MNKATGFTSGLLQLHNVDRQFHQGESVIDVLRNASLSINGGELTALVGPSGSGKSTLLNIAGLLERPSAGEVIIDGVATSTLGARRLGKLRGSHIGFVFQFHRLLPEFSALENVMIPQMLKNLARHEAEERAEALLAMVGLKSRMMHRPGALSGGEQQRVAIARAVANAPRVLLADEPTGNLDPETASEVFDHLRQIVRGTGAAALIVTHNEKLASTMDRRLTIRDGGVAAL
ncbi:ABC transporter ATP-binding protein [Alphaproteobacteria bacterium]|jgi:lipoprotein-releasing system ATP-binding protein|nr:ABC transporter ATP-binding protein [Alphaproteobacteria bacterium]